ncbi:Neurofilament heavy protein [Hirschfeldia incana]|nr:Neurofilament heavy protein [Hirschfeldia incana]
MEEFEHMIVEEFEEEDFYESIEAPKFVDLTSPDHHLPEGDDRYWFCSRVGCDQKHEEFMDSEAIYKRFVLRVMAARSPSVRLRKALYRKDFSDDPTCPNTVPAKPSRSRVSRLAMISSFPHQPNGGSMRPREVSTNKNATPKAKTVKGKESHKSLTERKMQMHKSPAGYWSVQNPRTATTTRALENRVVAKALVFHSPKKLFKLNRSVEFSSSVKKLCCGMRTLEIGNKRNGTSTPCKQTLRRRVFGPLQSQQQMDSTLTKRAKEKKQLEANGMELENQSLYCAGSGPRSEGTSGDETNIDDQLHAREDHDSVKESGLDTPKQHHIQETEGKQNASPLECDDKENVSNAVNVDEQSDDKENSSALESNRKVFGKKENCKTTQKGMTVADNCFNGKTVLANNTRVKYTKPKLTNPKPFRLRTDERRRRILKESNMEKKPQLVLAKEEETTNILGFHGENLGPKHESVQLEKNPSFRSKDIRGTSTELFRFDASGDMVNCKRVASGTMKQVAASKRVVTMNGESKKAAVINTPSVCAVASGEKRRPLTVPKGPNFHCIHVPKSCCCTK